MPKLIRAEVKNFRMLQDVEVRFEEHTTLVVGRNNSGKTSLSEVIRRFCTKANPAFKLQDFSASCIRDFIPAYKAKRSECSEEEIREMLPHVELRLHFEYDLENPDLGELNEFVIDLDIDCHEVIVAMSYELKDGAIEKFLELIPRYDEDTSRTRIFYREISKRIEKYYSLNVTAEDPNDSRNVRRIKEKNITKILQSRYIRAQRGLDDTSKDHDQLAKIIGKFFSFAYNEDDGTRKKEIAMSIEDAVDEVQDKMDGDFRKNVDDLLKDLSIIDYPDHKTNLLTTETILDIMRILSELTMVRYQSGGDVLLPESYNGLGIRNFISILLNIISFYEEYCSSGNKNAAQLVFIEEPESHLHPQMQEIFIEKIGDMVAELANLYNQSTEWPVQFVITTHSPHIANKSELSAIRYFHRSNDLNEPDSYQTQVKDLKSVIDMNTEKVNEKNLIKFMGLTKCDLYFADKVIIVEGQTEKLFLPEMIKVYSNTEENGNFLRDSYITVVEFGGSYNKLLLELLKFLGVQTLFIADIDPGSEASCLFHESTKTRNDYIKNWFSEDTSPNPHDLIKKNQLEFEKENAFLAFQCPEDGENACGRNFEDAFILANLEKFEIDEDLKRDPLELEKAVRDIAPTGKQKVDFALEHLRGDASWKIPKYIKNGLYWLANGPFGIIQAEADMGSSEQVDSTAEEQEDV